MQSDDMEIDTTEERRGRSRGNAEEKPQKRQRTSLASLMVKHSSSNSSRSCEASSSEDASPSPSPLPSSASIADSPVSGLEDELSKSSDSERSRSNSTADDQSSNQNTPLPSWGERNTATFLQNFDELYRHPAAEFNDNSYRAELLVDPRLEEIYSEVNLYWGETPIPDLLEENTRADFCETYRTALMVACQSGNVDRVRQILWEHPANSIRSRDFVKLITEASLNNHEPVILELIEALKPDAHDNLAIRLAAKLGLVNVVKELLELPNVKPDAVDDAAIILACEFGQTEVVNLLLKDNRVNPSARNDCPLRWGAQHGNIEIVNMLLECPTVNPAACQDFAIRQASIRGHAAVVERLMQIPGVNPAAKKNRAIRLASANGHADVVKLLLNDPRCDPGVRKNIALYRAVKNRHIKVVKLLLDHPRVDPAANVNRALQEALRIDHKESVQLLIRSKAVQREASRSMPPNTVAQLKSYYNELLTDACNAGQCVVGWYKSLCNSQPSENRAFQSATADVAATIAALAFGESLIVSFDQPQSQILPNVQSETVDSNSMTDSSSSESPSWNTTQEKASMQFTRAERLAHRLLTSCTSSEEQKM